MKKSILAIVVVASGFLFGTLTMTSCSNKKGEQQEQNQSEHENKADSTATTYACPMHPEVTGKQGDECSKCGMKLAAVKDAEKEDKK